MIFKFGRKQFSDVVKVVAFLDKENIKYEVLTDIEVALGEAGKPLADGDPDGPKMVPTVEPIPTGSINNDPLWRIARHDNEVCNNRECRDNTHYGAEAAGA